MRLVGQFKCRRCRKVKPDSAIGKRTYNGQANCKDCCEPKK